MLWLFLIPLSSALAAECPANWFYLPNSDICILDGATSLSFNDAMHFCENAGGGFIKITNAFLNTMIQSQALSALGGAAAYIGVEKMPDGSWIYADGSPLTYQKWKSGQPDNTKGCAVLDATTGEWFTQDCAQQSPFFCQRAQIGSTSVVTTAPSCTIPWKVFQDHCYYLQDFSFASDGIWNSWSFADAEAQCSNRFAHLASIHSDDENNFVNNLIATTGILNQTDKVPQAMGVCGYAEAWIGLQSFPDNTTAWTDGSPVDYIKSWWPSSEEYVYGMINDDGCGTRWNNWGTVAVSARFVCKRGHNF